MRDILREVFGKTADAVQAVPVPGVRQDTEHLTPRIEHAAVDNLPYRGGVNHGVAQDAVEMADETNYWNGRPVTFVNPPDDSDDLKPIPVVVVDNIKIAKRRISSHFESARASVGTDRVTIASPFFEETTVVITPQGGDIYVGGESVSTGNGFLIRDGGALTLDINSTLYAIAASAVTTYVLQQHRRDHE